MSKTIAEIPFDEIENLLKDLPFGPADAPVLAVSQRASICASAIHTNYLLAAILIELREIKARFM